MGRKIVQKNVFRLGEKSNSSIKLVQAIGILKISKKNVWRKLVFATLELLIATFLSISSTTIIQCGAMLEMLNGVVLAFFAVVFTGYALFQALIGDRLLMYLVNETIVEDGEEKSELENTNDYFVKVMLLQFALIILNLFSIIVLNVITGTGVVVLEYWEKLMISTMFIFLLLHINFETLWEVKSFIFNVFQLFNGHAFARIIDIVENDKGKG